jgi:membrane-associated phospholipid phosphatase
MTSALALHPFWSALLRVSYESVLPQVALLVVCLGWRERSEKIHEFCLALAIGAAITVAFWTMFPSFGAFSVYDLPQNISTRLSLDTRYAHDLLHLLANGPGRISPSDVKGLIGFPSFHAAMAALVVWYARSFRQLFWPCLAWNALVLVATPIHGGHHVVDVPAGIAVAALAVALAGWIAKATQIVGPMSAGELNGRAKNQNYTD